MSLLRSAIEEQTRSIERQQLKVSAKLAISKANFADLLEFEQLMKKRKKELTNK